VNPVHSSGAMYPHRHRLYVDAVQSERLDRAALHRTAVGARGRHLTFLRLCARARAALQSRRLSAVTPRQEN
jgi:hypothetical protein